MYLVITENDTSNWDDVAGVKYNYPSKYKNIILPGSKVLYYKGRIRDKSFKDLRLSSSPHYFGMGEIGKVYPDPNTKNQYFCEIENYIPFTSAVLNKDIHGSYFEIIPETKKKNYWWDGVRKITKNVYNKILSEAGLELSSNIEESIKSTFKKYPLLSEIQLELVKENIIQYKTTSKENQKKPLKKSSSISTSNYSSDAKFIGDRGEEIVYNYLSKTLKKDELSTLRWLAKEGEKPGYDISYVNQDLKTVCVEVKTTGGAKFNGFNLTKNELFAAKKKGTLYKIYLVSNCFSLSPKLSIIKNISSKLEEEYLLEPIAYKVKKIKK